MRGVLVPVDEDPVWVEFEGLEGMQEAVGGYIEVIPRLFWNSPAGYCNEEGKLSEEFKPNRAIIENGHIIDVVFGNMLFCGYDPETGDTRDITDEEAQRVLERFGGDAPEGVGSGLKACKRILLGVL